MASEADLAALEAQKAKVKELKAAGADKDTITAAVTELQRLKTVCGEEIKPAGKTKKPKKEPAEAPVKEGPSKKDLKKAAKKEAKAAGKAGVTASAGTTDAPISAVKASKAVAAVPEAAPTTGDAGSATMSIPSLQAGRDLYVLLPSFE